MEKKEIIINYLEAHPEVSMFGIERTLGMSRSSISIRKRYVPSKYVDAVYEYLKERDKGIDDYGLIGEENPDRRGIRRFMDGWQFGAKDKEPRFRDPVNGLWKRLKDWGYIKGEVKEEFKSSDGQTYEDETGEYWIGKNGVKVYFSYKFDKPFKR